MAARATRLAFRIDARRDALIRAAAASRGVTVTDFVLESACTTAEIELLDRRVFAIDGKTFDALARKAELPARRMVDARARMKRLARSKN